MEKDWDSANIWVLASVSPVNFIIIFASRFILKIKSMQSCSALELPAPWFCVVVLNGDELNLFGRAGGDAEWWKVELF